MSMRRPHPSMRGFSLMELMITVAIVGILATIAIPSYTAYVKRANRSVARTTLLKIAQDQESWFGDRKSYAVNFSKLYLNATSGATRYISADGEMSDNVTTGKTIYEITMRPNLSTDNVPACSINTGSLGTNALSYVLVATPSAGGAQASDTQCGTFCLSSSGLRGATGTNGVACWQR